MKVKIKVQGYYLNYFYMKIHNNIKKVELNIHDNTINIYVNVGTLINHYKYSIDIIEKLKIGE